MQQLFESTVSAEEIDSLGHLNVRYYLARVDAANRALFDRLGLNSERLQQLGVNPQRIDTYSRFRQEQFEGAHLTVHGGLLETGAGGVAAANGTASDGRTAEVRGYFEIRNPERDELAAVFITGTGLFDVGGAGGCGVAEALAVVDHADHMGLPEYAEPRSLSLGKPASDVALDELEQVVTVDLTSGAMAARLEAEIGAEDCAADGTMLPEVELMFVLFRTATEEAAVAGESVPTGPPIDRTPDGRRFSWAMMETRSVEFARPRCGDRIVFLGADVALGEKTRQTRRWMFAKDRGELLNIHDSVSLAIDLDARRSLVIPPKVRAEIERNYLPQFA